MNKRAIVYGINILLLVIGNEINSFCNTLSSCALSPMVIFRPLNGQSTTTSTFCNMSIAIESRPFEVNLCICAIVLIIVVCSMFKNAYCKINIIIINWSWTTIPCRVRTTFLCISPQSFPEKST